jgi:glycosyltransferase involved in cell wall biosynthesis
MAMLVQPTPEGLARGALELLNNPEQAQQLGEYGRSVAERNYSWSAFLEKNRKVYNDFTSLADEFPGRVRAEIIKS